MGIDSGHGDLKVGTFKFKQQQQQRHHNHQQQQPLKIHFLI